LSHLKEGGLVVTIAFHSLEDHIIKSWMNDAESAGQIQKVTSGVVEPGTEEIAKNPRSRSAKLRVVKRVA